MRKTSLVLLSTSAVLIFAVLRIELRTSVVQAKAETPALFAAETDSSVSLNPTPSHMPIELNLSVLTNEIRH